MLGRGVSGGGVGHSLGGDRMVKEGEAFEKWEPPMSHQGRPISTSDSVVASQDFAFDLTRFLLMSVDMADHNGPRDILILKGTLQMMTACIQKMHLSITRAEELEKAVLEAALEAAMNAERLTVSLETEKEGRRTTEREAFRLNKIVASAEKSNGAAIGTQAQLEGKVAELEAVVEVMAAERSALEPKHWQQGWDEVGAAYKDEVLVLHDKLFLKGWTSALVAALVPEGSPLFQDVPVPSRSLSSKTVTTLAALPSEVFRQVESANKT